jgi:SNF2 family DNA or RNA helicase
MLDIIAIHLDKLGICYNVIQGNIPPKKRNEYVFNATFNNISVILWRSVLLVEETGGPGENQICRKLPLNFHFIISIIYFSVIVSQWTKMLDIIAIHLDKLGICYNVIQGNIPPKKRNEYVEFQYNKTINACT